MRGRFAFPMQSTGRGIAAAPESAPRADDALARRPRAREGPHASARSRRGSVGIAGTDLPLPRRAPAPRRVPGPRSRPVAID